MNKNYTNSEEELDKKLKERYLNHSMEPEAAMWSEISGRMAERKLLVVQKRIRIFKVFSILLGIGFLSLLVNNLFLSKEGVVGISKAEDVLMTDSVDDQEAQLTGVIVPKGQLKGVALERGDEDPVSKTNTNVIKSSTLQPDDKQRVLEFVQEKEGGLQASFEEIPYLSRLGNISDLTNSVFSGLDRLSGLAEDMDMESQSHVLADTIQYDIADSHKVRGKWFFEGFGAPGLSYRSLSTNKDFSRNSGYNKSYFNSRESAELAWSVGGSIGYRMNSTLTLKSGIFISTHPLSFRTGGEFLIKLSDSQYKLYTSSGETTITLAGPGEIPEETVLKSSIILNYLSVPLMLEYRLFGNTSVSLGLNLEHLTSQHLNWESTEESINGEEKFNGISGLKSNTIGFSLGLLQEQTIFEHTAVILNPTFMSHLRPLSNTSPVHSYPNSFRLRIGVRRYF